MLLTQLFDSSLFQLDQVRLIRLVPLVTKPYHLPYIHLVVSTLPLGTAVKRFTRRASVDPFFCNDRAVHPLSQSESRIIDIR